MIAPIPTGQLLADRATLQGMRRRLGRQSVELLFDLTDLAEDTADGRIVEASLRDIASFAASSKDTVRRCIAQLERHRLVELLNPNTDRFTTPRYLLHLDIAGISIAA